MYLKPLYDQIVVKYIKKTDKKTASGLILPQNEYSGEYSEGIVVAVGKGFRMDNEAMILPLECKVGDHVLYRKTVEIHHKEGDDEFAILSEANVLAIKYDGEQPAEMK